jgi:two-component system, cell cycle sensor histidine kinase and response regulator CckA
VLLKKTILVVDDEEVIRSLMARMLNEDGYRVLTAPDGFEALRILAESAATVDLLLTDLTMPGMTGEQLARCAAGRLPAPRFLFVSGFFPAAPDRSLPGPLLLKPFARRDLLALVGELMTSAVT